MSIEIDNILGLIINMITYGKYCTSISIPGSIYIYFYIGSAFQKTNNCDERKYVFQGLSFLVNNFESLC